MGVSDRTVTTFAVVAGEVGANINSFYCFNSRQQRHEMNT